MSKLDLSFYRQTDTLSLARQLIGKKLCTNFDGLFTSGLISEVEAYLGAEDKASHAYGNRKTKRTETMYLEGGVSYVYLCYGIHNLFNIVTHGKNVPHAILVRNIIPLDGIEIMKDRRQISGERKLTTGPGTLTQAMGINLNHNNMYLTGNCIWVEKEHKQLLSSRIIETKRIGVDYAGNDANLPYRFFID